jgi:hypothetical protein
MTVKSNGQAESLATNLYSNMEQDKDTKVIPMGQITPAELAADIAGNIRKMEAAKRTPKASPAVQTKFPIDIFPLKLQELIKGAEPALGIPPDFLAAAVLAAVGIAAGATYRLELKPGSTQKPVFYLVLIGLPNSNKSGALNLALKPIMDKDGESFKAYRAAKAEFDAIASLSKKERQGQGITEMPPAPVYQKSLVSDCTPEALTSVHMGNLRGIGVYRDELAGWVKDFNRYHQGSEQEFWLSNWSGMPISIDRKTSEPIHIMHPAISVTGTIQPGVLEGLAKGERAANGFVDRLLFAWPDGLEKPEWQAAKIELYLLDDYSNAIGRLLGLSWSDGEGPNTLKLAPDAKTRLFEFFNVENKQLCDDADNELLQGIYGKFDFHTARLAAALHLLAWAYGSDAAPPLEVQADTVRSAIKAAQYFRGQSLKVYERLHKSDPIERLPRDKREVYDELPEQFQTADGQAIAQKHGMPGRTFRLFLQSGKGKLFDNPSRGKWEKLY